MSVRYKVQCVAVGGCRYVGLLALDHLAYPPTPNKASTHLEQLNNKGERLEAHAITLR